MTTPRERLYALDLFRFIAACSVTAYHFLPRIEQAFARNLTGLHGLRFGFLGVELFFMISGFVIALSIQNRSPRSFLVHRAARLFPTFWLGLASSVIVLGVVGSMQFDLLTLFANATMLPGYLGKKYVDPVYWTLAVEWKFYALMAAVMASPLRRHLDRVALTWSLLLLAIHMGLSLPGLGSILIFSYGSHFAFGVLVMEARAKGIDRLKLLGLLTALVGMVLSTQRTYLGFIPTPEAFDGTICAVLMLLLAIVFAGVLLWKGELFEYRVFRRLGACTYPLYLLHAGVGSTLIENWRPTDSVALSVLCSLCVLAALVTVATIVWEERLVPSLVRSAVIRRLAGDATIRS